MVPKLHNTGEFLSFVSMSIVENLSKAMTISSNHSCVDIARIWESNLRKAQYVVVCVCGRRHSLVRSESSLDQQVDCPRVPKLILTFTTRTFPAVP